MRLVSYKPSPAYDPVAQRIAAEFTETQRLLVEAAVVGLAEDEARQRVEERGLEWRSYQLDQEVVDASLCTRRVTAWVEGGVVVEAEAS
jgi:hypothetical protein